MGLTNMLSLIRRVRDTFAAGKAERRFAELESQTRQLLAELEHSLNKDAIRRATDARRLARARNREEETQTAPVEAVTGADDLHARKAAIRRRLSERGTLVQQIASRSAGGDE